MNGYDFTQPGGFPLDQSVLQFMQNCISTAAQAANLAGPLAILSGCEEQGNSVTAGFVVISGEILPFTAGLKEDNVIIAQTAVELVYQDGTPRATKFERVARFGSAGGVGEYNWADFKRNTATGVLSRLERLEWLQRPFLKEGGMVWWKGAIADIPAGWREVEAWRGKLPMPAKAPVDNVRPANFNIGDEGGSETVTIDSTDKLPKHRFFTVVAQDVNSNSFPNEVGRAISATRSIIRSWTKGSGGAEGYTFYGSAQNNQEPTISPTNYIGKDIPDSMNSLNPYKVGCWIEPIPNFIA